jgi:coenzyme F420-0:L-glutamate ligase/coenzyme F420-1:gamma-L-glutamate ligase
MTLEIRAVEGIGEVVPGTDLAQLVVSQAELRDGDVVVITSKVVSKALGLATDRPKADVVLEQTDRLVARRGGVTIVRTTHGLTMAAAGVDASNVDSGLVLPLPDDPDGVARNFRDTLAREAGVQVAVVISDTAGRAWRIGQTDIAIGCAGLAPYESFAGQVDAYGNELHVTSPAVADEVAAAAELASGKLGQRPITIVRGLDPRLLLDEDGPGAAALIREEAGDLFGLGARDAVAAALAGQPVRGFPGPDEEPPDLPVLASPGGLSVAVEPGRYVIHASPEEAVEAGMLKQRLLALAVAHAIPCVVDVEISQK